MQRHDLTHHNQLAENDECMSLVLQPDSQLKTDSLVSVGHIEQMEHLSRPYLVFV